MRSTFARPQARVHRSYATFEEALAEALRAGEVFYTKFGYKHIYAVRKRRSVFRNGRRVAWNYGPHDRWLVLTNSDVPDRRP